MKNFPGDLYESDTNGPRYAAKCNFWFKEYQKREGKYLADARALLALEKEFLEKDSVLRLYMELESHFAGKQNKPRPWNQNSSIDRQKFKKELGRYYFSNIIWGIENCEIGNCWIKSNPAENKILDSLNSEKERIYREYGFSYREAKRSNQIIERLIRGDQLIDWAIPGEYFYNLCSALDDKPDYLIGANKKCADDKQAEINGDFLTVKLDITKPRKVVDMHMSHLLDTVYEESGEDRDVSMKRTVIGNWTTGVIARQNHKYKEQSNVSRAVGLWLWDEIEYEFYRNSKRLTKVNAFERFEDLFKEHFGKLSLEGKNDSDYDHYIRCTKACIDEQKVLSFSKKKAR